MQNLELRVFEVGNFGPKNTSSAIMWIFLPLGKIEIFMNFNESQDIKVLHEKTKNGFRYIVQLSLSHGSHMSCCMVEIFSDM